MSRRPFRAVPLCAALFLLASLRPATAFTPDRSVPTATSLGSIGVRVSVRDLMIRQASLGATPGGAAEIEEDEVRQPDRSRLPQNPLSPEIARTPAGSSRLESSSGTAATTFPAPQNVALSVTGPNDFGGPLYTNNIPPDPMGAVGPTQYVVFVNGRIASFDKTTGLADGAINVDPNVFYGSVRNGFRESDPRIRYDRFTGRWFLVTINVTTPNRILIAVSDSTSHGTITPSTVFTFFFIDIAATHPAISTSCFADYPTLGLDRNALYVGTNNFCSSYSSSDGYVIRKTSLLDSGPPVVTVFRGLVATPVSSGPFTPQGVDNDAPTGDEGFFIGADNASFGTLVLRRVADPGGSPSVSANVPITVPATRSPILVDHLGNTGGTAGRLSSLDDRLFAAQIRNGRLWTAQNIGVNNTGVASGTSTRNGSRWYELDVPSGSGTPTVVQSGTVYTATSTNGTDQRSYWFPTVTVSGQGHVAMSVTAAGSLEHVNAGITGRLAGDPAGTMQTPFLVTSSQSAYNPSGDPGGTGGRRWGDYSYVSLDPLDDMTLWAVHEFCDTTNAYGVRITKLLAPPPATPSSIPDVTAGQSNVSVTLSGDVSGGAGFYDPGADVASGGPGFRHLTVAVTNGAASGTPPVVTSATWIDPATVQLVLDASAATPNSGSERYTVSVTNPDGQSAAAAILHVVSSQTAVDPGSAIDGFALGPVRPNPARGSVELDYQLPRESEVRLTVVDVQGRELAVLANGRLAAGRHAATWSGTLGGRAAPRGTYFVRLAAGGRTRVKRFVLIG